MAVFFELTTDAFSDRFDHQGEDNTTGRAGALGARRPLRGLEVKEDTYAMIKVIDMLGREIKLYDSGSTTGKSSQYTNFILQTVLDARVEKSQIVETFGDPYIYFYGEQPRVLDCNAVLINSRDFNWQAEFWANYNTYLRGSKCAEIGARVYLFYDDNIVEGYMMQATAPVDAASPMSIPLQFRLFVTNYRNISLVGDPTFPTALGVNAAIEWDSTTAKVNTITVTTTVQRGLIHDNVDEWTGPQFVEPPSDSDEEVEDLIEAAVAQAELESSNMDDVDTIQAAALDKANQGQGSGGASPAKKPASADPANVDNDDGEPATAANNSNQCVPGTETTGADGIVYCTGTNGAQIQMSQAPPTPAPAPTQEQSSTAQTSQASPDGGASGAGGGPPAGSGSFVSTDVPPPRGGLGAM